MKLHCNWTIYKVNIGYGRRVKCWCYLFLFPLCCCFASRWLIQLWMVILHRKIHASGWECIKTPYKCKQNFENIDRRLDTFWLVCVRVCSFVCLVVPLLVCSTSPERNERMRCIFTHLPAAAAASAIPLECEYGRCACRHDYRCQESNTKLWKCIVSATVEMSITAQYNRDLPPFDGKLLLPLDFIRWSFLSTHLLMFMYNYCLLYGICWQ